MLQRWMFIAALAANGAAWAQEPAAVLQALAPGEWLSYTVDVPADALYVCCLEWHGAPRERACRLAGRGWNFSTTHQRDASALRVLVQRGAAGAVEVRALDAQCALEIGSERVHDGGVVNADVSARWLAKLAPQLGDDERERTVAALALHAGTAATETLSAMARAPGHTAREPAIFWLGQTRGEAGARVLAELIPTERDGHLREQSIFSLSQNNSDFAHTALLRLARAPQDAATRGKVLFWLAQRGDADVEPLIDAVLREPGLADGLRHEAVFALSQLPDGRATPALKAVLTAHRDRATRKQALFWLAQQDDEAAISTLSELLETPTKR